VWKLGDFRTYSSIEEARNGQTHTGIFAINPTPRDQKVTVAVSEFMFETGEELAGAILTLVPDELDITGNDATNYEVEFDVPNEAGTVLVAHPGSIVAANWYGLLFVEEGSTIYVGTAQANLTWTITAAP